MGSWDSLLVRAPDSWSKGCEFEFRQEWWNNFLLQSELCVLTLIRCPLRPSVTAVALKTSRLFCQKCRWQVTPKHAYTLDPSKSEWADIAAVQAECENPWGNELTRNSSGNTRLQSSQLAEICHELKAPTSKWQTKSVMRVAADMRDRHSRKPCIRKSTRFCQNFPRVRVQGHVRHCVILFNFCWRQWKVPARLTHILCPPWWLAVPCLAPTGQSK